MGTLEVCVVGSGVVGLSTVLELQKAFRNAHITVIADKFNEETTSDGAAGIFRPSPNFSASTPQITSGLISNSFHHYSDLLSEGCGVIKTSGYVFSNVHPSIVRNPLMEDVVPEYRWATESELELCGGGWKYGSFCETLLIECRKYLPWAMTKFLEAGGTVKRATIESFSQLKGKYDIVVNCSGLGSRYLCHDLSVVPIRGQIVQVEAPWVDHFYFGEMDSYIIPQSEGGLVKLGGTRQYDSFSLAPCKYDAAAILDRCSSLLPSLRTARVVGDWVGLRPHRPTVRIEPEIISGLKVVHNYGHGGYGVTSAPGSAKEAVNLVRDFHKSTSSRL